MYYSANMYPLIKTIRFPHSSAFTAHAKHVLIILKLVSATYFTERFDYSYTYIQYDQLLKITDEHTDSTISFSIANMLASLDSDDNDIQMSYIYLRFAYSFENNFCFSSVTINSKQLVPPAGCRH